MSLKQYSRCQTALAKNSKMERISDIVEFRHQMIMTPAPTPDDRIIHSIHQLTAVLESDGVSVSEAPIKTIEALQKILNK